LTWLKIDDGFAEHPKIQDLADRTFRLHVVALCYSARNLTDGFIGERPLKIITAIMGASRVSGNVAQLVAAGLWDEAEGGYQIKDFLEYNPPADEVKKKRAAVSEKRRVAGKKGAEARWQGDGKADGKPDSKAMAHGDMAPSRPVPIEQETSKPMPVDNWGDIHSRYFKWADEIGFVGQPHAEALRLRPEFLEEAMRRVRSRGDVDNPAAYLTTVVRNLRAAQQEWRSSMPLEDRLGVYVDNAGHEYTDDVLTFELKRKGADLEMVARLLVKANERRAAA
jgi:hypothetical protein